MNQQQRLQLAQKAEEIATLRATLLAMLRRRWGIAALRANARLLLERLAFVGRGFGRSDSELAARDLNSVQQNLFESVDRVDFLINLLIFCSFSAGWAV